MAKSKKAFFYIPHTHWEGAVFKTREGYLEMGLPHILMALKLLEEQPSYRFVLDQAAYVKPFIERYPEAVPSLRKFIAEGRLQIIGGTDVMHDCNQPCGEALLRNIQYGKKFFKEALGVDVETYWPLDTFGMNAQMPQILRKAGFTTTWCWRGVPHNKLPAEFFWEGLDGTKIAACWLPFSYAFLWGLPKDIEGFTAQCKDRFSKLDPFVQGGDRAGLAGADVCLPEPHIAPLAEEFNRRPDAPFTFSIAVPDEYEALVKRRREEQNVIVKGELNPIFQGGYSSRIELKQWMRRSERQLLAAEQLTAVAQLLGGKADLDALWRAWEPVLFNQAHDLAAGVMTDDVYTDTVSGYEYSDRLAREMLDRDWNWISAAIDTRGEGVPVVVWNTLGWARTDVADVTVGFTEPGIKGVTVLDFEGQTVPSQIVESRLNDDGSLAQARIVFLAREVPALGYAVYRVKPGEPQNIAGEAGGKIENEYYRLTFDRGTGAITSIVDKTGNCELLAGPANVVTCQEDRGDLWELYHGLDGGSHVAMARKQAVPGKGEAAFSDEESGKEIIRRGTVFSEYRVAHPFKNGEFATTVCLFNGLRRIDIRTEILNNDKWVRYQALFPTNISAGRIVHEIPFGAIERPNAIEFPVQNWSDLGDGRHGVTVLNEGLPGNITTGGTLMLSLMRSHNLGAYGFIGGYEPGMSSDTGFQLGKRFKLHYGIMSHSGDWREARVWRDGLEFNRPLICRTAAVRDGRLPSRWGLLEISHPDVVISACRPCKDGAIVLRVYEAAGQAAAGVQIHMHASIADAQETDLLEKDGKSFSVENQTLHFDIAAFEIKTFKLRLNASL